MATPSEYLQTARLFYPQIDEEGHCMGNAMMGAQALCIPDLNSYIERLETIYYGALKPGTTDQRISLDDLKKLYDKINSGENVQTEPSLPKNIDEKKEDTDNPKAQTFIKAWHTFKDQLDYKNFKSSSTIQHTLLNENQLRSSLSAVSNTAVLKPKELYEQVMMAKKIQNAYLEKYGKQKLESFLDTNPYITKLMDIDIFFSNIAIYQEPQQFNFLLPENLRIANPNIHIQSKLVPHIMPIVSPVSLDSKNGTPGFIELDQFSNRYNTADLQILLNELANQIDSHYKLEKNIPFALRIVSHNHGICLGYDIAKKCWIYIESNIAFPSSVTKTNIGTVVISAFFGYQTSIQGTQTKVKLAYDLQKNKWILLYAVNRISETASEDQEKLAKALLESDRLIHLKSLQCNLVISVYANSKFKLEINGILDAWKRTDQFKRTNLLTGSKLTAPDDLGNDYLLHFACIKHDINTVRHLLNARVNVNLTEENAEDSTQKTALNEAVVRNYTDIANLLLEHKADPNILTQNNTSPLFIAIQENYNEIASSLIKNNADINFECAGQTPLMRAIINNNLTLFEQLIEAKADVNFQCKNANIGATALFIATQLGNLACVNRLIQLNANINILFQGYSALYKAIEINNLEIVNALIEAKADIDHEIPAGFNTLGKAAMKNSLPILERLLEAKANVNYSSRNANKGATALFMAVQFGAAECLQRLIAAGADMDMGIDNTTPLMAAILVKKMQMFDLLIQAKVNVNYKRNDTAHTALYYATQMGSLEYVIKLIAAKADVNAGFDGISILYKSIIEKHLEITDVLIKANADINAKMNGWTALHKAIKSGKFDRAKLLVERGANVDAQADNGTTPFTAALSNQALNDLEIITILLKHSKHSDLSSSKIEDSSLYKQCANDKIRELLKDEFETRKNSADVKNEAPSKLKRS